MRAEDVKPGMWVRDSDETFHVTGHIDDLWFRIAYLDGRSGMMERAYARQVEPWVPRVGEWVRFNDRSPGTKEPWRVDASSAELGRTWYRGLDARGDKYSAMDGFCEPCAPPEAKPETARRVDGGPVVVVHLAAGASTWPQRTRDHNATCSRCGGRAYQGIGLAKCVEPVCDDPETREPDAVSESMRYPNARCEMFNAYGERVYEAVGRGRVETHPTREGAIAAWRKAVRRG